MRAVPDNSSGYLLTTRTIAERMTILYGQCVLAPEIAYAHSARRQTVDFRYRAGNPPKCGTESKWNLGRDSAEITLFRLRAANVPVPGPFLPTPQNAQFPVHAGEPARMRKSTVTFPTSGGQPARYRNSTCLSCPPPKSARNRNICRPEAEQNDLRTISM